MSHFDPIEHLEQEYNELDEKAAYMASLVEKAVKLAYPVMIVIDYDEEGQWAITDGWDEDDEDMEFCDCPPDVCRREVTELTLSLIHISEPTRPY